MAEVQRRAGRHREAERSFEQSIESLKRTRPESPGIGDALMQLGLIHNQRGRYSQALSECRRARDILARHVGPGSTWLIEPSACIAEALIATGRVDAARRELEALLTPTTERELGPHLTAGPRFQLARALWATSSERPRARELARAALTALETAEGDHRNEADRIEAWLAAR